jgi:hypothetical protein
MYFNCSAYAANGPAPADLSRELVSPTARLRAPLRARSIRAHARAAYALSATREGASPHSCSRR